MPIFVVAGRPDCPNFCHALHVANYLASHLPTLQIINIQKDGDEWTNWLIKVNAKNRWHNTKSPVIWKELVRSGGKAYLIGGLSEFWEYCYDYYGLQSFLSKSDLQKLVADNLMIFKKSSETNKNNIWIVSITGATTSVLDFLLLDLRRIVAESNNQDRKLIVKVFEMIDFNEDQEQNFDYLHTVEHVNNLTDALTDCDLLIVLDETERRENEELHAWLERRYATTAYLADQINHHANNRALRVVVSNHGALCFDASVLVKYCTVIRPSNIVAVTADLGFTAISLVAAKRTPDIPPVERMGAPPVWGFVGFPRTFVDVKSIVIVGDVYKPYLRTITSTDETTLPAGTIERELRLLAYLIDDDLDDAEVEARQLEMKEALGRAPVLGKIRAIGSLLKLWYAEKSNDDDDIISLGVCSDGSFGFPAGIVLSQPVMLDKNKCWKPFLYFPVSESARTKIQLQLDSVKDIFIKFNFSAHE